MKRGTPNHPKMFDLISRLKLARWGGVGILENLWHFAATYAQRGDIGRHSNEAIARAVDWQGDAGELVEALIAAGWLDRCCDRHRLRVHDWPEHADQGVGRAKEVRASGFLECYREKLDDSSMPDGSASESLAIDEKKISAGPIDAGLPLPLPSPLPRPEPGPLPSAGASEPVGDEPRPRSQDCLELVSKLCVYRIRLGTRVINGRTIQGRTPTPDERQELLDALEGGRSVEALMGTLSERVREELIGLGHLARDAPWPPPGLAAYDPRDGPPANGRRSSLEHAVGAARHARARS